MADSVQAGIAPAAVALQQAGADLVPSTPELVRGEVLRGQAAVTHAEISLLGLETFVPALEGLGMLVPALFLRGARVLASCTERSCTERRICPVNPTTRE